MKTQEIKKSSPAEEPRKEAETALPGKSILVADDDELTRYAISQRLRSEGFEVTTASDGGEAIELMRKKKPDLIVLDLMMPYVSGPEFLHLLESQYLPEKMVPVIIISALNHEELLEGGYKLDGYHFISKPIAMEELIHWINHFLAFGDN